MAKTVGCKNDKKVKKTIDKKEPGEWSLNWTDPRMEQAGECNFILQTKETTFTAKHTVYLRSQGTQTV